MTSVDRAGHRHLSVEDAEQHDPAAGAGQFGAAGEARLGAGGVDHDVVLAAERAGAQALGGGALVRVAGLEVDARSLARTAATASSPIDPPPTTTTRSPVLDGGAARTVPGDRRRLDQAGVLDREPVGERDEVRRRHDDAVAQTPVDEDPEVGVLADAALGVPGRHWAQDPQQIVGSTAYGTPSTTPANSWPTVKPPRPIAANAEIGAADAARHHVHQLAIAGRLVDLDQLRATRPHPHRTHRPLPLAAAQSASSSDMPCYPSRVCSTRDRAKAIGDRR